MREPEKRSIALDAAEIRVERSKGAPIITGYAPIYGALSVDLGGFRETFEGRPFGRALAAGADVRFLVNHDPSLILGRNTSGTMQLYEDDKGLRYEVEPPNSNIGEHYLALVDRRDITGCSFRFYPMQESWDFNSSPPLRRVLEADIDDICLATYPAYVDSSAAVRSLEEARKAHAKPPTILTPRLDLAIRRQRLVESQ